MNIYAINEFLALTLTYRNKKKGLTIFFYKNRDLDSVNSPYIGQIARNPKSSGQFLTPPGPDRVKNKIVTILTFHDCLDTLQLKQKC